MKSVDFRELLNKLQEPTSILPLVIFRMAFGVLMLISTLRFAANGWIGTFYIEPQFHFTFFGFGWVQPLPGNGMYIIFALLALFSVMIVFGAFYRISIVAFFLLFTYVELIDKTYYLNHYYFISLLSFLLIFVPLHRSFSIDVWMRPSLKRSTVPTWMIWALRLQLGMVYFFAGFAKLNVDWMVHGLPLRLWIPANADLPILGPVFALPYIPLLMSWGGAIYDLTIAFFLSWRRTRYLAYLTVLFFHIVTAILFPIGMFPYIMIVATLIFFDERDYRRVLDGLRRLLNKPPKPATLALESPLPIHRLIAGVLMLFFLFQVLMPLRFVLYPGNVNWHEQGFRFAWRVMLVEKAGYATFFVHDPQTGKNWTVFPGDYLTRQQEKQMSFQADMILQYALFLEEQFAAQGYEDVEVRAEVYVAYNGRSSRLYIDPEVDLSEEAYDIFNRDWILPE